MYGIPLDDFLLAMVTIFIGFAVSYAVYRGIKQSSAPERSIICPHCNTNIDVHDDFYRLFETNCKNISENQRKMLLDEIAVKRQAYEDAVERLNSLVECPQ